MTAASGDNLDLVKYLVEHGANIYETSNEGKSNNYQSLLSVIGATALDSAASSGHLDTVKYLIECGAHVSDLTLELARSRNDNEICECLQSARK